MKRYLDLLEKAICVFLAVMIVAMLAVGSMQVFWRYILRNSLSWSEELLRFMYVWITMVGIAVGIRRKGLACISSFIDFVESKSAFGKDALTAIGFAMQIFIFAILIVFGTKLSLSTFKQLSPAIRVSMGYVYLAMPVGGVFSLIFSLEEGYQYFFTRKRMPQ